MIKYQLVCNVEHEFEGWFRDSADYDGQSKNGLVECPVCGTDAVRKAMMAPAIAKGGSRSVRLTEIKDQMGHAAERARDYVEKNFDYVGEKFPEEARKIHYGETKERGIFGEATGKEVKGLIEEGVKIAPLPGAAKKTDKAGKPKSPPADVKKLN